MGFSRGMKIGFDAQVKLNVAGLKPCPAAFGEFGRFLDFNEVQNADIEIPGFFFFARGHRDLDMVNG